MLYNTPNFPNSYTESALLYSYIILKSYSKLMALLLLILGKSYPCSNLQIRLFFFNGYSIYLILIHLVFSIMTLNDLKIILLTCSIFTLNSLIDTPEFFKRYPQSCHWYAWVSKKLPWHRDSDTPQFFKIYTELSPFNTANLFNINSNSLVFIQLIGLIVTLIEYHYYA